MTKHKTPTKVRLTIALGMMYKDISDMPEVGTPDYRIVRQDGLRTVRLLLDSPVFLERLSAKMDEVE